MGSACTVDNLTLKSILLFVTIDYYHVLGNSQLCNHRKPYSKLKKKNLIKGTSSKKKFLKFQSRGNLLFKLLGGGVPSLFHYTNRWW